MNSNDIIPGKEYALREGRDIAETFQHIRVIERVRGSKWRVEWIEPTPGLVDYVKSIAIICSWPERKKVAKDEQNAARLKEEAAKEWPGNEHPISRAVDEVFEATSEDVNVHKGILSGSMDALERVAARAGFEFIISATSYTDRFGRFHHPWKTAIELAKAFAAAEPKTVLLHIEVQEREWEIEARRPGGSYLVSLLEDYWAAWAIIRQWASFDAERKQLNEEIERLYRLANETIWKLRTKDVDPERISIWLERALKGR